MAEYIERGALLNKLKERDLCLCVTEQDIKDAPAADVAPVRHGRWERDEWGSYLRRCSVCKKSPVYQDERGNSVAVYAGVCINCGAMMDGEQ